MTGPNRIPAGETVREVVGAVVPVPLRVMVAVGFVVEVLLIVRVPVAGLVPVGANRTMSVTA